ncbi:unnamed protein product, partial [Effrenium voratum]
MSPSCSKTLHAASAVRRPLLEAEDLAASAPRMLRMPRRHSFGKAHQDSLPEAWLFAEELQQLLLTDQAFQASDLAFCSEPAVACVAMHRAGKPVLGYFGVHVAFMVKKDEDQRKLYRAFVDELANDPRTSWATKAPYLSLQ